MICSAIIPSLFRRCYGSPFFSKPTHQFNFSLFKLLALLNRQQTSNAPLHPPTNTPQTQHHIVERHGLKTAEELGQWLQQANETLSQKQDKDWKRALKGRNPLVAEKAVAKARKGGFYLGLDHTWLSWDT
jgi:hypothetical protein